MFRLMIAAATGSGVGSLLLGLWCGAWGAAYTHGSNVVLAALSPFLVYMTLSAIFSFVPVLVVTALLGPIAIKAARRLDGFSWKTYLIATAFMFLSPCLLFGMPGLGIGAIALVMYGFPSAIAYVYGDSSRLKARLPFMGQFRERLHCLAGGSFSGRSGLGTELSSCDLTR
jgi:hypothetical protein